MTIFISKNSLFVQISEMINTKVSVNDVEMSLDIYLQLTTQPEIPFSDENVTFIAQRAMTWVVKVSLMKIDQNLNPSSRTWIFHFQLVHAESLFK